jgi:PEP-CTERM motif
MRYQLLTVAALASLLWSAPVEAQYGGANGSIGFSAELQHTAEQFVFLELGWGGAIGDGDWRGYGTDGTYDAASKTASGSVGVGVNAPPDSYAEATSAAWLQVLNASFSPFLLPILWDAGPIFQNAWGVGSTIGLWLSLTSSVPRGPQTTQTLYSDTERVGHEFDTVDFYWEETGTAFVTLPAARVINGVTTPSTTYLSITAQAYAYAVTPEPASMILLGTGLLAVAGIALPRRNRVA